MLISYVNGFINFIQRGEKKIYDMNEIISQSDRAEEEENNQYIKEETSIISELKPGISNISKCSLLCPSWTTLNKFC